MAMDLSLRRSRFALQAPGDALAYVAIAAFGTVLFWLSAEKPAALPFWAPWDFSPPEYAAFGLTLFWYLRGLRRCAPQDRPRPLKQALFLLGMASIWAVTQTRFDYMAQHMFFINRIQHVVMHHLGPFLIALGGAGGTIWRGMPGWARRGADNSVVRAALKIAQQPLIASILFVGLFYFWLIPPIHFRAMLDARLYALMNWSMTIDGLLFWSLVLDPRPRPAARISFGARAALSIGVMFPQIALGALIAFAPRDLYPYYDLCGRLFPSIDALSDQQIAGVIIWIPPAMMSVAGLLLVLNAIRLQEDSNRGTEDPNSIASLAASWTGR